MWQLVLQGVGRATPRTAHGETEGGGVRQHHVMYITPSLQTLRDANVKVMGCSCLVPVTGAAVQVQKIDINSGTAVT